MHTVTHTSLLAGLREPRNDTLWSSFVGRYRPPIVAFAKRRGLKSEDAEDAAQAALLEFTESYRAGKYDRDKGRLRAWLFGIAHHQVENLRRKKNERGVGVASPGEIDELAALPHHGDPDAAWDAEWRSCVLRQAFDEVRHEVEPRTFEAFHEFAVKEHPAAEVARRLGISENAVFGAKRRVLARLREILPLVDDAF